MFGQPRFAAMNGLINDVIETEKVLIVAHRGRPGAALP